MITSISPEVNFEQGSIILINKDLNWTSFDVVGKIRSLLRKKYKKDVKVGHAGTLDPLATGLLILCTGKCTKQLNDFLSFDKEYFATLRLGETTPSFDLETEVDRTFDIGHIEKSLVEDTLKTFEGDLNQLPPVYSAKKINGKRSYEYARQGKTPTLEPCRVNISEIALVDYQLPYISIRVRCSKGTYIRALARDIGNALQTGAYLSALSRTAIGSYTLEKSLTIIEFEKSLSD